MNPLLVPAVILILMTFRYLKYFNVHGKWVTAITILFQQISCLFFKQYCGLDIVVTALIIVSGALGLIYDSTYGHIPIGAIQVIVAVIIMACQIECITGVATCIVIAICAAVNLIQILAG